MSGDTILERDIEFTQGLTVVRGGVSVPVTWGDAETAANTVVCLIHQANYLLDRQLRALEEQFLREGGITERLYRARQSARSSSWSTWTMGSKPARTGMRGRRR